MASIPTSNAWDLSVSVTQTVQVNTATLQIFLQFVQAILLPAAKIYIVMLKIASLLSNVLVRFAKIANAALMERTLTDVMGIFALLILNVSVGLARTTTAMTRLVSLSLIRLDALGMVA